MNNQPKVHKIGIQANGLGGSWHERALREYLQKTNQHSLLEAFDQVVIPYSTHEELIAALDSGEITSALAAVDNPYSGRVESTVTELRDHKEYSVDAVIGIRIPESELYHEDVPPHKAQQIMSQKPALDQVWHYRPELARKEHSDTFGAALDVLAGGGCVDGVPTIAVGSPDATRSAHNADGKLKVGAEISKPDNMTQFWLLSRHEADPHKVGQYTSFVMSVGNGDNDLLNAIQIISEQHDFDLSDIDCHLTGAPSEDADEVDFFVTAALPVKTSAASLLADLEKNGNKPVLMGTYDDYSDAVETQSQKETAKRKAVESVHESWKGRAGVELDDDHDILYIQAKNIKRSLLGMLRAMEGMRKVDMSRPIVPEGNGARGFYFVMDRAVTQQQIDNAITTLTNGGYRAEQLNLEQGKLVARH